jgi:PIN domain nuclease of toxin-antitoxin system
MNVLDASAVLAVLNSEPGASDALRFFDQALLSAVNLSEVLQKAAQIGVDPARVHLLLGETEIGIVPFDETMAVAVAGMWPMTKNSGLSLGDRACLALADAVNGIAVTADRTWAKLELPSVVVHVLER